MVGRAAIKSFCRAVAKQFRPQAIILFGSYAYGHPTPDSDVDLLVIMPKTRERGERMSVRIRHAVPRNFPMDLLVRTPKEMARRLRWGDVFVREVMEKGQVMYEANDARDQPSCPSTKTALGLTHQRQMPSRFTSADAPARSTQWFPPKEFPQSPKERHPPC